MYIENYVPLFILFILIFIFCLVLYINNNLKNKINNNCYRHLETNYKKKRCTLTDDDENKCQRILLDEYIITINKKFSVLRCLEYSIDKKDTIKYQQAQPLFISLYKSIYQKKDINSVAYFQEFMKELYQRNIYYYPIINQKLQINNISIHSYVKNNDCIIPLLENKIKADLLHFDTHPDHKDFEKFDQYDKLINQEEIDIQEVVRLTYDIGCFSSYYLYYSKKNFFWITPTWTKENNNFEKKIHKMIRDPTVNRVQNINSSLIEKDSYIFVKGKINQKFEILTQDITKDFVLSIDLDFFSTNGLLESDININHNNKKNDLLKDSDQASYGRTRMIQEFPNPYFYYDDNQDEEQFLNKSISYTNYINDLKTEFNLIKKRVLEFKKLLEFIKKNKKVNPVIIIISDSSNVHLSTDLNSITLTNDFCPQNIVMYVRHLLFEALQEVYSDKIIPFLEFP